MSSQMDQLAKLESSFTNGNITVMEYISKLYHHYTIIIRESNPGASEECITWKVEDAVCESAFGGKN